jgi:hypothetical protein
MAALRRCAIMRPHELSISMRTGMTGAPGSASASQNRPRRGSRCLSGPQETRRAPADLHRLASGIRQIDSKAPPAVKPVVSAGAIPAFFESQRKQNDPAQWIEVCADGLDRKDLAIVVLVARRVYADILQHPAAIGDVDAPLLATKPTALLETLRRDAISGDSTLHTVDLLPREQRRVEATCP